MKKNKSKRTRILGNFGWLTNVNDHRQHEFDKRWKTCVEMILDSLDSFKAIKKKNNFFVHSRYYYDTLRTINFIKIISKKNKQTTNQSHYIFTFFNESLQICLAYHVVHTHEDDFYVDSSDVKACMIVKRSHSSVAWGPQQRSCPDLFSHWLLPIKRSDFHLVHGCPF